MKNSTGYIFIALAWLLYSCQQQEQEATMQSAVAGAYGVDHFGDAKSIAFTFNIDKDSSKVSRSWLWDPAANTVTFYDSTNTITYRRDTVSSASLKSIDGKFINDQYWLLFPYHLQWDSAMTVSAKDSQQAPLSKAAAKMITVQYSSNAGYTPGDAYDLFVDGDNHIMEWNFRKSGAATPTMTTTWSKPVDMNGLKISTDHYNADSSFHLYFTDVKVNQ